ncbi:MAG: AAA family ATPase [Paludibacteraceae bacterium]|nr:AAA family ATPase [Paludibacteraceae bacterium]
MPTSNDDIAFINEVISYNKMWYPSNIEDFDLSSKEYTSYMDTANTPYYVIEINREHSTNHEQKGKTLQQIYYGTPGSGKSRKVKGIVKDVDENFVFRTTFHPDSDYASFVGCYKPVMKNDVIKYQFTPQTFTKAYVAAWNNQEQQIYLIIEEINRGNCAQIFGDLFQLLDRENGVSEYPIDADNDLKDYLEQELGAGHEGIKNGKLKLPANLNILATMNTSDQSLFPMDSAFKRRWAWECVPVNYTNSDSGKFTIKIGDSEYKWHDFLLKANNKIKDLTFSEDKQMGNFFISSSVDKRQFIDEVMFYLWNDICKDEYGSGSFFRRYIDDDNNPESEFSFNDLFGDDKKTEAILNGFMEYLAVEKIEAATSTGEEQ